MIKYKIYNTNIKYGYINTDDADYWNNSHFN